MFISISNAADDDLISVPVPWNHAPIRMACDVLLLVMEHDGDGTVETYDDDEGVEEWRKSAVVMDETAALDRILLWMLDCEDDQAALATILLKFRDVPGNLNEVTRLLAAAVIAIREMIVYVTGMEGL